MACECTGQSGCGCSNKGIERLADFLDRLKDYRAARQTAVEPNRGGVMDAQVCTMDAKVCPDGSAVGRTGPNCTFPACPTTTPATTTPPTSTAPFDLSGFIANNKPLIYIGVGIAALMMFSDD